jgi:DNA-binding beta-propeller fold protein YncE
MRVCAQADDHKVHKVRLSDGQEVKSWGSHGKEEGQFDDPSGIAELGGYIWVADMNNHRLQCFKPDGGFIRTYGSMGESPGQFREPGGLTSASGRLYVAEVGNSRVQVLKTAGQA